MTDAEAAVAVERAILKTRSSSELMSALLDRVKDSEWSGRHNTSCRCHPEYVDACPQCDATEREGKHEDGCSLLALIDEVRAFLEVENELAEARGEEPVAIP